MLDTIPNNVNLEQNPKLQRALLHWHPKFLDWWKEVGPEGFQQDQIYLRTAIGVSAGDWAIYDYVKMPDYRWGIFLANPRKQDSIYFGDKIGEKLWPQVPGEFRKELRRLIVTQGDTEPASVEAQRLLGKTAPSLVDLRNLFQINVEEARHLWAMVYLLHSYFGADGRDEAEEMLVRRSGHEDHPRILQAFNKPIDDWLAFFCFTMFTDRDGKFQLAALAESAFDPLARSTMFMLTEEAFHLSVGDTGIQRVVRRTAELMQEGADPEKAGAIPLAVIQKYINEWASACYDLFGGEDSSNAATYFGTGLKGRFQEGDGKRFPDHLALDDVYTADVVEQGKWTKREIPMRRAMNACLLDDFITDLHRGLKRWNKVLEDAGVTDRLTLPNKRFNRNVGIYADSLFAIDGEMIGQAAFDKQIGDWLPSREDYDLVQRSMVPVFEPGKVAGWIAPPTRGFGNNPTGFEYVLFH